MYVSNRIWYIETPSVFARMATEKMLKEFVRINAVEDTGMANAFIAVTMNILMRS